MPLSVIRVRTLGILFAGALTVLAIRLWWLQLTNWSEYATKALGNRVSVLPESAPRGLVRDCNGLLLAENREVWSLEVVPVELPKDKALLEKAITFLAGVLSTEDAPASTAGVRKALKAVAVGPSVRAAPLGDLGQDLTFDQVASIEEHQMEFPGITVATTTRRHYPYGSLAAQAIGYARPDSGRGVALHGDLQFPLDPRDPTADVARTSRDLVYDPGAIVGEEGVEALCELDTTVTPPVPILPGRAGRAVYEVDATGTPQRLLAERPPTPGATVWLTIDAQMQFAAQEALREAIGTKPGGMGAAVVMDVTNGDVLLLASEPCLDPNDWVAGMTAPMWKQANEAPGLPQINKAIAGRYPPGSVFKIISICAAYETTKVRETTTAYCTGTIHVGRRHQPFRCWTSDRGGHGAVNLLEAIARSCNIFFYDTVLRFGLDPDTIARYAREFGLGETTGLGLRGEVAGSVPSARYSVSECGVPWQLGNSLNFVIGQDRLTVTPLQMCVACAAVANGGRLPTPNIISRIQWPAYLHRPDTLNHIGKSRPLRVQPKTLAMVREGMKMCVTGEHGTGGGLKGIGVTCAGKTGSAQPGGEKRTHAWFIAYTPTDVPRYAVCVFASEAGTGAEVAVPVAGRILRSIHKLFDPGDPQFTLPPPLDPRQAAEAHRQRNAEAKAWLAAQAAAAQPTPASGRKPAQSDTTPRPSKPERSATNTTRHRTRLNAPD